MQKPYQYYKYKTAYCAFNNFDVKAKKLLQNADIEATLNSTDKIPQTEELISLLENYDILIIGASSKLDASTIRYITTPKIIATLSVGLDHIDQAFFESPLVTIISLKTANTISVAEHIFALILALNKRIIESNHLVINGNGHQNNLHERPEDISGKTLGLIGCGNIAKEVTKIASAFNMPIKCYTKHPDQHQDMLEKGVTFAPLSEVMETSDIINVSIPLNAETKNLISKNIIHLMKPTATFINTSRAEVVDIKTLINYADKHETFYVGLDINTEKYKELFGKYRNNVIITPHTAGVSKQAIRRMDLEIANKITNLIQTVK